MEQDNTEVGGKPTGHFEIKNRKRRQEMFKEVKKQKQKEKKRLKLQKMAEAEEKGIELPKQVPKTLENLRIPDETIVDAADAEIMHDENTDEFADYFSRQMLPKVFITNATKVFKRTKAFCAILRDVIPNSFVYFRRGLELKKIIKQCSERGFTDIIVVNEDRKKPNALLVVHLPDGPTAHFKLSNLKLPEEIKRVGAMTKHQPEVILNNFSTRLGHSIGRMLASLFPQDPHFHGRRAVTFHNQRDFIFFRHHRYQFRNRERVGLQELGPRFTLKLRSLQKGTFDSKHGQYEWVHKRHEMETSRRKFFL